MIKNLLKHKSLLIICGVLLILFIVLLCLVKAIHFEDNMNSAIARLDKSVFEKLGYNKTCDIISDIILALSFGIVAFMFGLGCYRLFWKKELDLTIVVLGCFYIITLVLYILFDHIHINYAPMYDGELKESFPSSHTLATLFISLSAIMIVGFNIKNVKLKYGLTIGLILIAVLMVIFRMLSGWHWFTDILAGELLALFLVTFYALIVLSLNNKTISLAKKDEE